MPLSTIYLPQGSEPALQVEFAYLSRSDERGAGDDAIVQYLQGIRSSTLKLRSEGDPEHSPDARLYHRNLSRLTNQLADLYADERFDIIVAPPSSRADSRPYVEEFRKRNPAANDWTGFFSNPSGLKSGPGVPFENLLAAILFDAPAEVDALGSSALIVDESFHNGTTAGVTAFHLRQHPKLQSLTIAVAVPLWHPAPMP